MCCTSIWNKNMYLQSLFFLISQSFWSLYFLNFISEQRNVTFGQQLSLNFSAVLDEAVLACVSRNLTCFICMWLLTALGHSNVLKLCNYCHCFSHQETNLARKLIMHPINWNLLYAVVEESSLCAYSVGKKEVKVLSIDMRQFIVMRLLLDSKILIACYFPPLYWNLQQVPAFQLYFGFIKTKS